MKKKLRFKGILMLICLMLVMGLGGTDVYAASSKKTTDDGWDTWKTYQKVNAQGKLITKCYYHYPKIAKKYGVPETWFRKEGIRHYTNSPGCPSYTVICSKEVDERTGKKYMESACAIYVNEYSTPAIDKAGQKAEGYVGTRILYASSGMLMSPGEVDSSKKNKTVELKLTEHNPDLICHYRAEYKFQKSIINIGTVASLFQSGVNVATGDIKSAISETVGWASTLATSTTNKEKIELEKMGADEYHDSGLNKIKSISVGLNKNVWFKANDMILLKYTEIYPSDAANYYKNRERNATARFIYKFSAYGKEKTYKDNYTISYKIKWDGKINLKDAKKNGMLKVVNSSSIALTGEKNSSIKPKVTVEYKGKALTQGTDYTVKYKNCKVPGTAKVIVTGKGNYTGTVTEKYQIFLPIPRVTAKITDFGKTKDVNIELQKVERATGYEIYRSTDNKNFKLLKKTNSTVYQDKTLKANKTYYYKVRAYLKSGGKIYYSGYTSVCVLKK